MGLETAFLLAPGLGMVGTLGVEAAMAGDCPPYIGFTHFPEQFDPDLGGSITPGDSTTTECAAAR